MSDGIVNLRAWRHNDASRFAWCKRQFSDPDTGQTFIRYDLRQSGRQYCVTVIAEQYRPVIAIEVLNARKILRDAITIERRKA